MTKEHLSTDKPARTKEEVIDQTLQDSFPTSDPPSFSPGAVGAPSDRKSEPATPDHPAVKEAENKVKSGAARIVHKY